MNVGLASTPYFSIYVNDLQTEEKINTFNAIITRNEITSNWNTTTGEIITDFVRDDATLDVKLYNIDSGNLVNYTYTGLNYNTNLNHSASEALVTFTATEIITNNNIEPFIFTIKNINEEPTTYTDTTLYQCFYDEFHECVETTYVVDEFYNFTEQNTDGELFITTINATLDHTYYHEYYSTTLKITFYYEDLTNSAVTVESSRPLPEPQIKTITNPNPEKAISYIKTNIHSRIAYGNRYAQLTNLDVHYYVTKTFNSTSTNIPLSAQEHNISIETTNYYPITTTITPQQGLEQTITISDLASARINLNATNAFTGNLLNNLSGWIYNNDIDENISYSTTSNNYLADLIPGNYTVFLEAEGYAIGEDNTQNITIGLLETNNLSFSLYTKNSININIYDEESFDPITENVSITFSSGAIEFTNYTTSGTFYVDDLTDGQYVIKFNSGNYTQKNYIVTVAEGSTQNLNAYLSTSTTTTLLTVVNLNSGTPIEAALISVERSIGDEWTIVENRLSDISGKAPISYVADVKYRFSIAKEGYETKVFILDPVLFDSYTVKLTSTAVLTDAPEYQGVGIVYTPSFFTANEFNNLTFTFTSPEGLFTTYNLSVVYPGGSQTFNGHLAIGQSFNHYFNITGANFTDHVVISYCYDTTISSPKCFVRTHSIRGVEGEGFIDKTYGMGLFTRIALATLILLIVAGLVGLVGGVLAGGFTGLFMAGLLVAIGFIPLWTILPTMAVGFFLLVGRSSQ
jgi:hypothetical protein